MRVPAALVLAFGLAAPVLSGAAARAQASPAPAAPVSPPAAVNLDAPVRLEITFKAGQSYSFRVTDNTVLLATLPSGDVRRSNTRTIATFSVSVERANTDGTYAVRVKPTSQSVTVNGREATVSDALMAEATAVISRDGILSQVSGDGSKSEAAKPEGGAGAGSDGPGEPGMSAEDFLETLFDKDAGFPTRALKVGEGWKDRVKSPVDGEHAKVTVNNTLLTLDVLQGHPVARVLNVVAEPVQVAADEDGVSMAGMLEGGGLSTVDLGTGLVRESQNVIRLKMTITAPGPEGSGTVNVGSEANIKVRIQSLEP